MQIEIRIRLAACFSVHRPPRQPQLRHTSCRMSSARQIESTDTSSSSPRHFSSSRRIRDGGRRSVRIRLRVINFREHPLGDVGGSRGPKRKYDPSINCRFFLSVFPLRVIARIIIQKEANVINIIIMVLFSVFGRVVQGWCQTK